MAAEPVTVILATTTSTQDTGLLDALVPAFEKAHPEIRVKAIAVGTGEALAMGRRGDADVLVVHARAAEDAFMAESHGLLRYNLMHNDFVLAGPPSDPAGVRGRGILDALKEIAVARATFVTRGDGSGTHTRELALWKQAGVGVPTGSWYLEAGQGMGATARIASEKQAYTLMDRGSFLALQATLALTVVSEGGEELLNRYGVIVVSPRTHPGVRAAQGRTLADWLVSAEGQKLIGEFGVTRFGRALFVPDAPHAGAR
ncbi:MAG: substrate-binding domain-containing protein [Thermoanaerobaculaceae bacterium]|jgi:tungstate transport system substrate-binding protein|nr:substrate-binding domain-containing protein [Thermoanaerobaculaceae bacterium]